MNKLRCWLARKSLQFTTKLDYSLKPGDRVASKTWTLSELIVVDVNWGLLAVALRLGKDGNIVVWPVWSVQKMN